ncbi:hypothetical protein LTR91_006192 [Friedmanniomyces endolithicus]|uniref:Uncharacterized protein n=1 Tax=Friedmanniomyces endolithicus TaxID=329885 RepID=A0AAN6KRR2_9PEZI|nr:hypothetical protein LTR35_012786 [Friedmanniomyces endolithicus]KAK0297414.1 hypothetical protein LTS00_004137 [Friedmanniomyces endolithicus]KAK0311043.1 hypothetical protein LTR82_014493 [Friedmanniomyces endolithicus]KAK0924380.1 hypothetical protein LTR57_005899 [Friedmanniomyces endolithicus]KAK0989028.1 hypothetical protein LTR54_012604 [Friedmanniomyces endolithicus]
MSHEEQQPVGLGITFAEDDVNNEENNAETDPDQMQADEEDDGITSHQTEQLEIVLEAENEEDEDEDEDDREAFYASLSKEDDEEQEDEANDGVDPLDTSSNVPAHDQPTSDVSDAKARARYGSPPTQAFAKPATDSIEWNVDDFTFYKWGKRQRWGSNQEKYWKIEDDQCTPLYTPGLLGRAWIEERRGRPGPPSWLRKARSMGDLSPEASPKERSPVSPVHGSQDHSAMVVSSVRVRSASLSASSTSHDWAEEDDGDTSWVANFQNGIDPSVQAQTGEADATHDQEDEDTHSEQSSDVGVLAQSDNDEEAPLPAAFEVDDSDADTELEDAAVPDNGAEADPNDSPAENPDAVVDATETKSPISPASSNASSVDSTTGMTQREGLAKAEVYFSTPTLAKRRSQLKLANEGRPEVDAIPERPKDRLELLEVKVHSYRKQCEELMSAVADYKKRLEHAETQWNSIADEYEKVLYERNGVQETLNRVEKERARLERRVANGMRGYDELRERLATVEAELYALKEENIVRLEQMQQAMDATPEPESREPDHDTTDDGSGAQGSSDKATQTDSSTVSHVDTQTDPGMMPSRRRSSPSSPPQPPLLRPDEVIWPAQHIAESATQIADWINERHAAETGGEIEPLQPAMVRDILGNGTTPVSVLIDILEHAGYVFRPDHFAGMLVELSRDQGRTANLEAMYIMRRFTEGDNVVRQLLEEVDQLEQNQPDLATRLHKEEMESMRLYDALEHCREHGAELEADKVDLQTTAEKMQVLLSEAEARNNELEKWCAEEQAARIAAVDELVLARSTIEALEKVEQEQLPTMQSGSIEGVESISKDERIEQLVKEVEELKRDKAAHIGMMQAAKRTIVRMEELKRSSMSGRPATPAAAVQRETAHGDLLTPAATTAPTFQRSAQHAEREGRAGDIEASRRTIEALSKQREEASEQREKLAELRRQAYRKLRGVEEIPYLAEEERLTVLLQMI